MWSCTSHITSAMELYQPLKLHYTPGSLDLLKHVQEALWVGMYIALKELVACTKTKCQLKAS